MWVEEPATGKRPAFDKGFEETGRHCFQRVNMLAEKVSLMGHAMGAVEAAATAAVEGDGDIDILASEMLCDLLLVARLFNVIRQPELVLTLPDALDKINDLAVLRDKARSSDTTCAQALGAAFEDVDFYSKKMSDLQKNRSLIMDAHPCVQAGLTAVEAARDVTSIPERCALLDKEVLQVSRVTTALEATFVETYTGIIQGAIGEVVSAAKKLDPLEKDCAEAMTRLLASASTAFPFNPDIPDWQAEFAEALVQITHSAALSQFLGLLATIATDEAAIVDVDVSMLAEKLKPCEGMKIHHENVKTVVDKLLDNVLGEAVQESKEFAADVLKKCAQFLPPDIVVNDFITEFESAFSLSSAYRKLTSDFKSDNGDIDFEELAREETFLKYYNALLIENKSRCETLAAESPLFSKIRAVVGRQLAIGQDTVAAVGRQHRDRHARVLRDAINEVATLAHGIPGGNWLDGLPKKGANNWAAFLKHAEKTILKEAKVANMKKGILAVSKARAAPHSNPTIGGFDATIRFGNSFKVQLTPTLSTDPW